MVRHEVLVEKLRDLGMEVADIRLITTSYCRELW